MRPGWGAWTALERALSGLRYGTVQVVVHDGQIVRIERVERIRLTDERGSLQTNDGRPTLPTEERRDARKE